MADTEVWGIQITQLLVPEPAAGLNALLGLAALADFRQRRRAV